MSFANERTEIAGRFQDLFVSAGTTEFVPVQYPNKPRPDVDKKNAPINTWARFSIRNGDSATAEIGALRTRNYGVVFLEIFTRENNGEVRARECAEKMKDIFQNKRLTLSDGDILFRECALKSLGEEAGWEKHNVSVGFQRDEIKALA